MVTGYEYVKIQGDEITPSQLIWRRYKRPARTILGLFLDVNPELAGPLGTSPFLPIGMVVRVPIDRDILAGRPPPMTQVRLYGES
jgi:hypothetical protein